MKRRNVKVKTKRVKGQPRNKFEQAAFNFLELNKALFQYEQVTLPYLLEKKYLSDYTIYDKTTGKLKLFIEIKGYFRSVDQTKMRAVKKMHPDADIRFVFQDASKKVRKGAKLTYGDWATKWGFIWAEGSIPKAWLK